MTSKNSSAKLHKCKCKDPGFVLINSDNNELFCKVSGIDDSGNIKIIKKEVICTNCNKVIYKEKS